MGKFRKNILLRSGIVFMAVAVLITGFHGGIAGSSVSAASDVAKMENKSAPDTAGLFYSNTICVYENTVYAIEAGNLTKKTADENDTVETEILVKGLSGAKSLNITEDAFYTVIGNEVLRIGKASFDRKSIYVSENTIKLLIISPSGDFYTLENGAIYKNGSKDFTYVALLRYFFS